MKKFKANRIIFSLGAVALGVILLVWPATSLLVLARIIGAVLAVGGIVMAIMCLRDRRVVLSASMLVLAVVMIICGIVVYLHPGDLVSLIPTVMGVLVLLSGIVNLGETFTLTRQRYGRWWVSLLVALATIALGIILITKAFGVASMITRIAGIVLIFDGVSDLWVISRISTAVKDAVQDANAVDVEAEIIDEKRRK